MPKENQRDIERVVARMGDLPAMPAIVADVLRLADDPATGMADMSDAIQRDPGLTAKILRVSNSPYYGMRGYVGSLKLALVILGLREVRNIVLAVSVFDVFRDGATEALIASDFWNHSFTVGALTKKLAGRLELAFQGEDFVAGLLHDIGKLVLWRQIGADYIEVFRVSGGQGDRLAMLEAERFGFTHADAAAALAMRWNLPQSLADALWCHCPGGRPLSMAKDLQLAALVRIADLATRDDDSDRYVGEIRAWTDEEAWVTLIGAPAPIEKGERQELLRGYVKEIQETPPPEC